MAKIVYNENLNIDTPTLLLKKRDYTTIGAIANASEIVYKDNYNSANELTFKIYKSKNALWDEINDYNVICIPEYNEYYDMQVSLNEEDMTYKNITCTPLAESELSNVKLYDIEINTEDDIARPDYDKNYPTIFYRDLSGYDKGSDMYKKLYNSSLLHRILDKASNYKIGDVSPNLKRITSVYSFSISDTDIYSELIGEIAENYKCRFEFDSANRTINVYDLCNTCNTCGYRGEFHDACPECGSIDFGGADGDDTTIFVSKDNLATSATIESNKDQLKNCFRVTGGDELITTAIAMSNPNGSNYIYYFSDEMFASMPDNLANKIKGYNELYNEYLNIKEYVIDSNLVDNYNSVINYIKGYYPDVEYSTIKKSTITGYKNIAPMIYDAIDLGLYIQSGMMKTPDVEGQGIDDAIALLTASTLGEIGVSSPSTATKSMVENAIIGVCKLYVNTALYKISIEDGSTYTKETTGTWTWKGKFKLTSIEDKTVTKTSISNITLTITGDEETFLKQKIEKAISLSDNTFKPLQSRIFEDNFAEDDFKKELHPYSINYLQGLLDMFSDCYSVILESNNPELQSKYSALYNTYITDISNEITYRTNQLGYISAIYSYGTEESLYEATGILNDFKKEAETTLNFEVYLEKEDLWKVFCSYRREDSYRNDNYISDNLNNAKILERANDLLDTAKKELFKAGNMQYSVSANLNNLLALKEFQPIINNFKVGNWIHLEIDDKIYHLRLLSYQVTFDDLTKIDVEFSTVEKLWSGISDVSDILSSASSIAGSYSYTTQKVKENSNSSKFVKLWVDDGFTATSNKIVNNADNIGVTFDRTGITCAKYDDIEGQYEKWQTKILDTGLYVTNDSWKTTKAAIGKYYYTSPTTDKETVAMGVIAETIVGKFILGENLGIYTENQSMAFNTDGLTITNGTNTFVVNPNVTQLVKIQKNEEDIFYIDDDGNLNITGNMTATSGTFNGTVNASGGTFTNTITCNGIIEGATLIGGIIKSENFTIDGSDITSGMYIDLERGTITTNNMYLGDGRAEINIITNISQLNSMAYQYEDPTYGILSRSMSMYIDQSYDSIFYIRDSVFDGNVTARSLSFGAGALSITNSEKSNLFFSPDMGLYVQGRTQIDDATTLSSTLDVSDNTTLWKALTVYGATTLNSTLSVTGNTIIGSAANTVTIGEAGTGTNATSVTINNSLWINPYDNVVILKNNCGLYGVDTNENYTILTAIDDRNRCLVGTQSNEVLIGKNPTSKIAMNGSVEIYGSNPHIDFHYNNASEDYNVRLQNSESGILSVKGNFVPSATNTYSCGSSEKLWSVVYAKTGAINTSDRKEKDNIIYLKDEYDIIFDDLKPVSYKFIDGTSNRTHIGFISNDIEESLINNGMTALDFAGFCKDARQKQVIVKEAEYDEEGNIISNEVTEYINEVDEDGNVIYNYALRYSEFIALNTNQIQKLKARVNTLEESKQKQEIAEKSLENEISILKEENEELKSQLALQQEQINTILTKLEAVG